MLLLGPIYGYHKKESITNPEANMNIVSLSLRKNIKKLLICHQLDIIGVLVYTQFYID